MKKILYIIGILIALLIGAGVFYYYYIVTVFKTTELYINDLDGTIYLKNLRRGLNYNELTISSSKGRYSNLEKDYVYTWDETLFYRVSQDTLFVFCKNKAEEPTDFNSKIKIIQEEYSNPEYYELLKNFKTLGMEKFPIN